MPSGAVMTVLSSYFAVTFWPLGVLRQKCLCNVQSNNVIKLTFANVDKMLKKFFLGRSDAKGGHGSEHGVDDVKVFNSCNNT